MSLLGALPFVLSGDVPNYLDAVFETVSGFTAALACISNIGPGMGQIDPASCFNIFSAPVKMVLAVHHAPRKTGATSDTRILRADDVEKVTARRAVLQKGRKCEIIISVDKTVSALAD